MNKKRMDLIADLHEGLEKLREWKPFYLAVLKNTGSKDEAKKALLWALKMEQEEG